jgi:hypothetical protein
MKTVYGLAKLAAVALLLVLSLTANTRSASGQTPSSRLQTTKDVNSEVVPVTLTTVYNKTNPVQALEAWFDEYAALEEIAATEHAIVDGYDALTFFALVDGRLQRGLAIDIGDGRVVVHLTTDRKANAEDMIQRASPIIQQALMTNALTTSGVECNCVAYARTQVALPAVDLTTYSAKLAIINHRFPRVGAAAVIPSPSFPTNGHLAVVRNVAINADGSLTVTLQEANWTACKITTRSGKPENLNIQGYFDPTYPAGSASPRLDKLSVTSGSAGRQFSTTASGGGFDANSTQAMLFGGACNAFGKCVVPNSVMTSRSSSSLTVPLTINTRGTYTLYFFNPISGKTSNGKTIVVN